MTSLLDKLPFAHQTWFMYVRSLITHFMEDDCQQKAASLTYTTLLSLVPIITVILVVFSIVPALAEMREQVQNAIYNNLLPTSQASISNYINGFAEKSSNLGLIGVLGVFVTTIMTLVTIEEAFNKIWRVQERFSLLASVLRYWTMITLTPVVLGVAFGASSAISGLSLLNQQVAGYGIDWAIWARIISVVVMTAGFIGMYWFIPRVQVPIKNAVIAGVVVAILFETLKQIFGVVMGNFTSYEAIYGAFAALPVFLLWIYLSWNVILLGVEISYTLTIFDPKKSPSQHAMLSILQMLSLIYDRHQQGKTVSEHELRAVLSQKELPKWSSYIHELVERELIIPTKDSEYILRTDLDTVNLWQFYKKLPYPLPLSSQLISQTNEPWVTRLATHLARIEKTTEQELNMTLGGLFKNTPTQEPPPPSPKKDSPTTKVVELFKKSKELLKK